jgi:hypothetical protein
MKKYFLALALIGITVLSVCLTRADDTNTPAPSTPDTNAPPATTTTNSAAMTINVDAAPASKGKAI